MALFRRCGASGYRDLPIVGLTAAVLAHVRKERLGGQRVAGQIGPDNTGNPTSALLKPGRFRRLLDADTPDERLIAFIRRGNSGAFEALVARYETRLLAFCRHLLGSREARRPGRQALP